MKTFLRINWGITTLLSIATGLFKLMQQEADIQLFEAIGFSPLMTTLLGLVQLIGGLLLIPARTRKIGAWIMIPTYIIAAVAVFANQMTGFGIVSIVFILMALGVWYMEKRFPAKGPIM